MSGTPGGVPGVPGYGTQRPPVEDARPGGGGQDHPDVCSKDLHWTYRLPAGRRRVQFYFAAVGAFAKPQRDGSYALHDINGSIGHPAAGPAGHHRGGAAPPARTADRPDRAAAGLVVVQLLIVGVGRALSDDDGQRTTDRRAGRARACTPSTDWPSWAWPARCSPGPGGWPSVVTAHCSCWSSVLSVRSRPPPSSRRSAGRPARPRRRTGRRRACRRAARVGGGRWRWPADGWWFVQDKVLLTLPLWPPRGGRLGGGPPARTRGPLALSPPGYASRRRPVGHPARRLPGDLEHRRCSSLGMVGLAGVVTARVSARSGSGPGGRGVHPADPRARRRPGDTVHCGRRVAGPPVSVPVTR